MERNCVYNFIEEGRLSLGDGHGVWVLGVAPSDPRKNLIGKDFERKNHKAIILDMKIFYA